MKSKAFILLFLLIATTQSMAIDDNNCHEDKKIQVGYFNGVNNTKFAADKNLKMTLELLNKKYKNYQFEDQLYYNHTDGFLIDVFEVFVQRLEESFPAIDDRSELFFSTLSNGTLSEPLFKQYRKWFNFSLGINSYAAEKSIDVLQKGYIRKFSDYKKHRAIIDRSIKEKSKLLLIAHSQGNLFANKAYDYLISKKYNKKDVNIIHVAPASVKTHGRHIVADKDIVISTLKKLTPGKVFGPTDHIPVAVNRYPGLNGQTDISGHGYLEIYLNPTLSTYNRFMRAADDFIESGNKCPAQVETKTLAKHLLTKPPKSFFMQCDPKGCIRSFDQLVTNRSQADVIFLDAVKSVDAECKAKSMFRTVKGSWDKKSSTYNIDCATLFNQNVFKRKIPVQIKK